MRPAPLLAVAASAVLGLALGVGGGLLTDGASQHPDPLGLGAAFANQSCTGGTLLVVASGDTGPTLSVAIAQDPHVRYLDTARSCDTTWAEHGKPPRYAAYLGPYATRGQACAVRMTAEHRGDLVTRLHAGNTQPVRCLCYLPMAGRPVLRLNMAADVVDGIWIRALQRALTDLGYLGKGRLTSFYDVGTVEAVKRFQHDHGLPFNGVVDTSTWLALTTQGCKLYAS